MRHDVMDTTIFSDEIVNVSKFRGSQSHWLSVAVKRPVTVTSGDMKVTILNRELVRKLYLQKQYLELAIQFCNEVDTGKDIKTLPWAMYLDKKERKEFRDELLNSVMESITTDNWDNIETIMEDWKATAETEHNEAAMSAINERVSKDKYIPRKSK
jgi:hypothetical protein